jgi:hypothetical protein
MDQMREIVRWLRALAGSLVVAEIAPQLSFNAVPAVIAFIRPGCVTEIMTVWMRVMKTDVSIWLAKYFIFIF